VFLDNLLPASLGMLGAPVCFLKKILYPDMISFGLLANLSKMRRNKIICDIDSIWDVGANCGQFAVMANLVWHDLPICSFEPDPICFKKLEATFAKFAIPGKTYRLAISENNNSRVLNRYEKDVNNSFLNRSDSEDLSLDEVEVDCRTLDNFIDESSSTNSIFLKLDVQGFELIVLSGAKKFLEKCKFVQIEVSFSPSYNRAAHAGEILLAMRENGFTCINILDLLRDRESMNIIVEADLLFRRDDWKI
jgi:FkbM family methyltransferase